MHIRRTEISDFGTLEQTHLFMISNLDFGTSLLPHDATAERGNATAHCLAMMSKFSVFILSLSSRLGTDSVTLRTFPCLFT